MHQSIERLLAFFKYDHLPPKLQEISKPCAELANNMAMQVEGSETTVGLRKLLEARDCFIRARSDNSHLLLKNSLSIPSEPDG